MLDQTLLPAREETLVVRGLARRWSTPSGACRSAAPRRSAWRARWGWPWPPPAPGATDLPALRAEIGRAAAALRSARPTAVNLAWAVDRMCAVADAHPGPGDALAAALAAAARAVHDDEVARCRAIGAHALPLMGRGARIMTICNAGALATGGYGTALGVVRAAHAADPAVRVIVPETRPLLQGSRLTAWELDRDGIAHTLITDSMAAAMMAAGAVSHVVVGADRIAANGDVANKIGTYGMAVLAREHGIPVIVAAPTTTVDLSTPGGRDIPIEERAAEEVRGLSLFGRPGSAADDRRGQPGLRRDARPAGRGDRHRDGRAPAAVRALAARGGAGVGRGLTRSACASRHGRVRIGDGARA